MGGLLFVGGWPDRAASSEDGAPCLSRLRRRFLRVYGVPYSEPQTDVANVLANVLQTNNGFTCPLAKRVAITPVGTGRRPQPKGGALTAKQSVSTTGTTATLLLLAKTFTTVVPSTMKVKSG